MLANPNKPVDLLCMTVAQKYFIFVVLGLGHFVLPYAWTSIIAVFLVSIFLHLIRSKQLINPAVAGIERLFSCGRGCTTTRMGYISPEGGLKNAQECSDNLMPFNRREVTGHVRNNAAYRQRVS